MKLVTFAIHDTNRCEPRVGVLSADGSSIIDLQTAAMCKGGQAAPHFRDMLALLDAGPAAIDDAARLADFANTQRPPDVLHAVSVVQLLAPVTRPRSIRDCLAFEQHLVQSTRTVIKWKSRWGAKLDSALHRVRGRGLMPVPRVWYQRPIYYKGNPASVAGPGAEIIWPAYTDKLDFELEFAVFIGRKGKDIPVESARQYVAGYTIFNDFSARDVQLEEMQGRLGPAKGKDFDTGNAIGPYLVTPDEVPDPQALTMIARVNGEEWSRGNSRDMHFSFDAIISYISQCETLYPGDFIGSGTVPGGCGLELDRWIQPGDVVDLEVDRLGVLRNRIRR